MENELDYINPHYCPIYERTISADLCYDSLVCLNDMFKIESVKELTEINDIKKAKQICRNCPYSVL